jgi:ankyrin repeat protein
MFYLSLMARPSCHDSCPSFCLLRSDSRSFLTASYRSLLRTYHLSPHNDPPPQNLITLLSSPRARLIDLSYLDDASGTTLLHEATRRKDFRLVELAIRAGADVFIRDRKGRPVQDVVGKDDNMRMFLRQCKYNSVLGPLVLSSSCSREQRHHALT